MRSALDRGDRDQKRQAERSNIEARLAALSNRERDVLKGLVAWTCQQTGCVRPWDQPSNDRELSGQSHDQDAGRKPVRSRAHGLDRRNSRSELGSIQRILSDAIGCPTHPAGTFADLSHIKAAVLILVLFAAQHGYPEPQVQAKAMKNQGELSQSGSGCHRH